jgi:hypothetical protein
MNFEMGAHDVVVPYQEQVLNDIKRCRIKDSAFS